MQTESINTFDTDSICEAAEKILLKAETLNYKQIANQIQVPDGFEQDRDVIVRRMIDRKILNESQKIAQEQQNTKPQKRNKRQPDYKNTDKALEIIANRELTAPAGWPEGKQCVPGIIDCDDEQQMALIGDDFWYEYSRRHGSHFQKARYLVGCEDGQHWAIRVPGTCETVEAALTWSIPAAVTKAQEAGYPVKRQGDLCFVGKKRGKTDLDELRGTRHEARERQDGGWTIVHPQHKPVRLSGKYNWRAYQCRQDSGENGGGSD